MSSNYVQLEFQDVKTQQPSVFSKKRIWMIGGIVAVVCIFALGLGLGLGLQNGGGEETNPSPPPEEIQGCYRELQHSTDKRSPRDIKRKKRWADDGKCPEIGEAKCPDGFSEPPLILVSLDGFRADYLARGFTPHLKKLSDCGSHAPYMRSVYPTSTFPNHYTIVTGLYPETNGMISNKMYDPVFKEQFSLYTDTHFEGKWFQGDPLWFTAKKEGKKTASLYWPGSYSDIQDSFPDICYHYDSDIRQTPYDARVDEVLSWLDKDASDRPDFMMLYIEEPDIVGHAEGPFGDDIDEQLQMLDTIIARLMDGLTEHQLDQCVNLMFVSDHGMGHVECGNTVPLSKYLDVSQYYTYTGASGRISSKYVEKDEEIEEVEGEDPSETLEKLKCTHYNDTKDWYLRFYKKENLPVRMHYSNNDRIDDIIVEVEEDYLVFREPPERNDGYCTGGAHGFDNTQKAMNSLFLAYGPAFKQEQTVEPFDNIELYNLMSDVLGITPSPNNGTRGSLNHLLVSPNMQPVKPQADSDYEECPFPDQGEGSRRRNDTDCRCDSLEEYTNSTAEELDERLNLDGTEQDASKSLHLPLGEPLLKFEDVSSCMLIQEEYINGYSHQLQMPLWSAFTIEKQEGISVLDPYGTRTNNYLQNCTRPDVRLEMSPKCNDYNSEETNIRGEYLYPPGLSNDNVHFDALITSNIAPMYKAFRAGPWQELLFLLEEYGEKYNGVQTIVGPVFDYNHDGRKDSWEDIKEHMVDGAPAFPTHFFAVASYCTTLSTDNCEAVAVVLPHKENPENCMDDRLKTYLQHNVARVKDVELLTGLELFPNVDPTQRAVLTTKTEVGLWDGLSWMDFNEDVEEGQCPEGYDPDHPPLLLISLDGFKPEYVERNLTPTIKKLRDSGTTAKFMKSIYPSHTFPNHYTVVTGHYPETHGIIDNNMFDVKNETYFCLGCGVLPGFWDSEPLWNTLKRANKTAVTMFWPGSDVPIKGMKPHEYWDYNGQVPYPLRVSTILDWLAGGSPHGIPSLAVLYFSKVDSEGHEGGPNSLQLNEALEFVDHHMKDLMDGIYKMGLHKCINVMVTSDHGMSEISCPRTVLAKDYLQPHVFDKTYMYPGTAGRISNRYYRDDSGPNWEWYVVDEADRVPNEDIIRNMSCQDTNLNMFDKTDLPVRYHYSSHDRIDQIISVLADTWQVGSLTPWCNIKGQHGFDPFFETMRAFFVGYGPAFKTKTEVEHFENIELYNILAHLTGVEPNPNNGTEGSLYHILKNPPELPDSDASDLYDECDYPEDDDVYEGRADLGSSGCDCETPENRTVQYYDKRLNMSNSVQESLIDLHLPHGIPGYYDHVLCVLHHQDFISGYSHESKLPAWTSFNLTSQQGSLVTMASECVRPDVRLEQNEQILCTEYDNLTDNMVTVPLFPQDWSSSEDALMDAQLLTNVVPMYEGFYTGIWSYLLKNITQWAEINDEVHVVFGPVFDHNGDGIQDENITMIPNTDIPHPSHYYAIIFSCPGDCSNMAYTVQAFVLPHKPKDSNCLSFAAQLQDNLARIRDIEILTGLEFLTKTQTQEAIQTRTFVPLEVWDTKT